MALSGLLAKTRGHFYSRALLSPWAVTRKQGPSSPCIRIPSKLIWISHPKVQDLPFSEIPSSLPFFIWRVCSGLVGGVRGGRVSPSHTRPITSSCLRPPAIPQSCVCILEKPLCSSWDPLTPSPGAGRLKIKIELVICFPSLKSCVQCSMSLDLLSSV